MLKRVVVILIMIVSVFACSLAATLEKGRHSYIIVLHSDSTFEITDSLFYNISRKVIFPVNKYDIPKDSKTRRELLHELGPYLNDNTYHLKSVMMRGAASPEGPYGWNVTLSQRRKDALLGIIDEYSSVPLDSALTTIEVPEDYVYLLLLLKERGDRDYDKVAAIVDEWIDTDQARLKRELMKTEGGTLWRRLLRDYFPEMRGARVVLVFRKDPLVERLASMPRLDYTEVPRLDYTEVPRCPTLPEVSLNLKPSEERIPRRELLSVKTNLLFDFAYMPGYDRWCPIPNVAIEYYPLHGHFTYGASLDFPWWQHYWEHKYFQIRNYQFETRYYLKSGDVDLRGYGNGAAFRGWYLQGYAHLGLYGLCFDEDRGWEGEGFGAGVGIGYVMPISKKGHWRLEFGLQVGYFWTKYDPYQYECPVDPTENDHLYYYKWTLDADLFKKRQYHFTWLGPTRVGVTLSYDLLYRKRTKKGVSLRGWEKAR